jgi:hypothetical protein
VIGVGVVGKKGCGMIDVRGNGEMCDKSIDERVLSVFDIVDI